VLDRTIDSASDSAGPEAQASGEAVSKETAAAPHVADRMDSPSEDHAETHGETHGEAHGLDDGATRLRGLARLRDWLARGSQFFVTQSSSSLTRRIVVLNVTGLVVLSIGIIFLSQFRAGLIDARIQSLQVQGEIIAGAIASSATVETDSSITLDPDKLLNLHPGESYGPNEDALYGIDFPINPERVAPILRRLVSPTKTRARIYDRDGVLLVDSRNLFGRGDVLRFDLPPPT
jgi:two-component system, OmpR family, sensor histidine kinase ChvG